MGSSWLHYSRKCFEAILQRQGGEDAILECVIPEMNISFHKIHNLFQILLFPADFSSLLSVPLNYHCWSLGCLKQHLHLYQIHYPFPKTMSEVQTRVRETKRE